ncbi:hypothetical protein CTAYLR_009900 [Chrysophaeum taylorii]|uniref:Uncharacterized protein n=1 Tax=Chrysophaeum taylorii TaxID=2483200 RepID=A0AAD7UJU7_9STRA|nr:hypothetical protein CTAYLR_009900 [Chrysophaeum taylorii]
MLWLFFAAAAFGFVAPRGHRAPPRGVILGAKTAWEREYKAYVRRNGFLLTGMSWVGFEELGPGCIVANRAEGPLDDDTTEEALKSIYVPEDKFVASEDGYDASGLEQILKRVRTYDPKREFVVVFSHDGVMGADIVTPSMPPPKVATLAEFQEVAAQTKTTTTANNKLYP